MKTILKLCLVLILFSFVISAYSYSLLPNQLASHWNVGGEVDGYLPKASVFFMPILLVVLFLVFNYIPKLDPIQKNIESFQKYYHNFILVFVLFMFAIHLQIILWNLNFQINFNLTIPILLGILLFYLGILLENSKRNWFIGIRTPWTLSSDEVWDQTHKFGGKIFKIIAVLMLSCLIFPNYAIYIILILAVIAGLGSLAYSYFAYQKINSNKTRKGDS